MAIETKICGLTNSDDVTAALDAGADYLGFVLYAGSPRGIDATRLRRILDAIPCPVRAVGVFVNESRANVERAADDCGLHAIQLNGDEAAADFEAMRVPVWRSVRTRDGEWSPAPSSWQAARFVVDASVPGMYGGTGVAADWDAAARLASEYPVMLAGGLTPGNVADAARTVRPAGVDVASGVESVPGRKDHGKLHAFIENVKAIDGER